MPLNLSQCTKKVTQALGRRQKGNSTHQVCNTQNEVEKHYKISQFTAESSKCFFVYD